MVTVPFSLEPHENMMRKKSSGAACDRKSLSALFVCICEIASVCVRGVVDVELTYRSSRAGKKRRKGRGESRGVMSESREEQGKGALTRGVSPAPEKRWLVQVKCTVAHPMGNYKKAARLPQHCCTPC